MTSNAGSQAPIQFRPGHPLDSWIAGFAGIWKISDNEATKRLAALAASRLDVDQYQMLVSLSEALAGPFAGKLDFVRACEQVKVAVEAANRTREQMGKKPLVHDERSTFITRTIDDGINTKRAQRKRSQEQQKIQIRRT